MDNRTATLLQKCPRLRRFLETVKAAGLDVRISEDLLRIELRGSRTGRILCTRPISDFLS